MTNAAVNRFFFIPREEGGTTISGVSKEYVDTELTALRAHTDQLESSITTNVKSHVDEKILQDLPPAINSGVSRVYTELSQNLPYYHDNSEIPDALIAIYPNEKNCVINSQSNLVTSIDGMDPIVGNVQLQDNLYYTLSENASSGNKVIRKTIPYSSFTNQFSIFLVVSQTFIGNGLASKLFSIYKEEEHESDERIALFMPWLGKIMIDVFRATTNRIILTPNTFQPFNQTPVVIHLQMKNRDFNMWINDDHINHTTINNVPTFPPAQGNALFSLYSVIEKLYGFYYFTDPNVDIKKTLINRYSIISYSIERRLINVTNPRNDNDAVTLGYMKSHTTTLGTDYIRKSAPDAGGNPIKNVGLPVDSGDAINKRYLESHTSTLGTDYIKKSAPDAGGNLIKNVGTPVDNTDAANKEYVDTHVGSGGGTTITDYIKKSDPDAGGNRIKNVGDPIDNKDVVTKQYFDTGTNDFISKLDPSVNGRRIKNVGNPQELSDAANKLYVDVNFNKCMLKASPDAGGNPISNVGAPVNNKDAINKDYFDNKNANFVVKSAPDVIGNVISNVGNPGKDSDAANKLYVDKYVLPIQKQQRTLIYLYPHLDNCVLNATNDVIAITDFEVSGTIKIGKDYGNNYYYELPAGSEIRKNFVDTDFTNNEFTYFLIFNPEDVESPYTFFIGDINTSKRISMHWVWSDNNIYLDNFTVENGRVTKGIADVNKPYYHNKVMVLSVVVKNQECIAYFENKIFMRGAVTTNLEQTGAAFNLKIRDINKLYGFYFYTHALADEELFYISRNLTNRYSSYLYVIDKRIIGKDPDEGDELVTRTFLLGHTGAISNDYMLKASPDATGNRIKNVGSPVDNTDAVNKIYVHAFFMSSEAPDAKRNQIIRVGDAHDLNDALTLSSLNPLYHYKLDYFNFSSGDNIDYFSTTNCERNKSSVYRFGKTLEVIKVNDNGKIELSRIPENFALSVNVLNADIRSTTNLATSLYFSIIFKNRYGLNTRTLEIKYEQLANYECDINIENTLGSGGTTFNLPTFENNGVIHSILIQKANDTIHSRSVIKVKFLGANGVLTNFATIQTTEIIDFNDIDGIEFRNNIAIPIGVYDITVYKYSSFAFIEEIFNSNYLKYNILYQPSIIFNENLDYYYSGGVHDLKTDSVVNFTNTGELSMRVTTFGLVYYSSDVTASTMFNLVLVCDKDTSIKIAAISNSLYIKEITSSTDTGTNTILYGPIVGISTNSLNISLISIIGTIKDDGKVQIDIRTNVASYTFTSSKVYTYLSFYSGTLTRNKGGLKFLTYGRYTPGKDTNDKIIALTKQAFEDDHINHIGKYNFSFSLYNINGTVWSSATTTGINENVVKNKLPRFYIPIHYATLDYNFYCRIIIKPRGTIQFTNIISAIIYGSNYKDTIGNERANRLFSSDNKLLQTNGDFLIYPNNERLFIGGLQYIALYLYLETTTPNIQYDVIMELSSGY